MLTGEGLASSANGVERVGLGAVASRWPVRPVELDDQFAALDEESGESGAP